MARAEEPDLVAVLELAGQQPSRTRQGAGPQHLRTGSFDLRCGRAQGETFHDALNTPVPPVVEQVGSLPIVARALGKPRPNRLGPLDHRAAGRKKAPRPPRQGLTDRCRWRCPTDCRTDPAPVPPGPGTNRRWSRRACPRMTFRRPALRAHPDRPRPGRKPHRHPGRGTGRAASRRLRTPGPSARSGRHHRRCNRPAPPRQGRMSHQTVTSCASDFAPRGARAAGEAAPRTQDACSKPPEPAGSPGGSYPQEPQCLSSSNRLR